VLVLLELMAADHRIRQCRHQLTQLRVHIVLLRLLQQLLLLLLLVQIMMLGHRNITNVIIFRLGLLGGFLDRFAEVAGRAVGRGNCNEKQEKLMRNTYKI